MLLFISPRMQLAFFAVRICCWLMLSLLSMKTPSFFQQNCSTARLSQVYIVSRDFLSKMQDLAFFLVEFHRIPVGPFIQPFQDTLDGSTALKHVSCSLRFSVICRTEETALSHLFKIMVLNSSGPREDPCIFTLFTSLQVGHNLLPSEPTKLPPSFYPSRL